MSDFTVDEGEKYYSYKGKDWVVLQNGENILFTKREKLMKFSKYAHILLCDKDIKDIKLNISDVDRIFIKKKKGDE